MAQQFRALVALLEDPSSLPRIHMTAHNCLQLQFQRIQIPLLTSVDTACMWCTYTLRQTMKEFSKNSYRCLQRKVLNTCESETADPPNIPSAVPLLQYLQIPLVLTLYHRQLSVSFGVSQLVDIWNVHTTVFLATRASLFCSPKKELISMKGFYVSSSSHITFNQ